VCSLGLRSPSPHIRGPRPGPNTDQTQMTRGQEVYSRVAQSCSLASAMAAELADSRVSRGRRPPRSNSMCPPGACLPRTRRQRPRQARHDLREDAPRSSPMSPRRGPESGHPRAERTRRSPDGCDLYRTNCAPATGPPAPEPDWRTGHTRRHCTRPRPPGRRGGIVWSGEHARYSGHRLTMPSSHRSTRTCSTCTSQRPRRRRTRHTGLWPRGRGLLVAWPVRWRLRRGPDRGAAEPDPKRESIQSPSREVAWLNGRTKSSSPPAFGTGPCRPSASPSCTRRWPAPGRGGVARFAWASVSARSRGQVPHAERAVCPGREALSSPEGEREQVGAAFVRGTEESAARAARPVARWRDHGSGRGHCCSHPVARPTRAQPQHTAWTPGARLVRLQGKPVRATDVPSGGW